MKVQENMLYHVCIFILLVLHTNSFVRHVFPKLYGLRSINSRHHGFKPGWNVNIEGFQDLRSESIKRAPDLTEFVGKAIKPQITLGLKTLIDLSRMHHFSLNYLGDYVCQLGCPAPLKADIPIENFMDGEQIYSLLNAITSVETSSANLGYVHSTSARQLAEELQVDNRQIIRLCERTRTNLPFGLDTIPHSACIEKIKRLHGYDTGVSETDDEDEVGATADPDRETGDAMNKKVDSYYQMMMKLGGNEGRGFDESGFYDDLPQGPVPEDPVGAGPLPSSIVD